MRIASLLPACTEWVAAFGAADELVGRSHACDYPARVQHVPVVTDPARVKPPAGALSQEVRAAGDHEHNTRRLYSMRRDLLADLAPDILLTGRKGSLFGVPEEDVRQVLSGWTGKRPSIFAFGATSFKGVLNDALALGKAIGQVHAAMQFIADAEQRLRTLQLQLGIGKRIPAARPPTIACIDSLDPLTTAGYWVPDLVELAGGRAVSTIAGEPSQRVGWSDIERSDPDVIAVMLRTLDLEQIRANIDVLTNRSGWDRLKAVKDSRVIAFDGNAYMNRPGPRLYRSIELVAAALHRDHKVTEVESWEMETLRT